MPHPNTHGSRLQPLNIAAILLGAVLVGAVLLGVQRKDYPHLHIVLDTGNALLSGVLALLFWDLGLRSARAFPQALAASFAATSLLEILHTLVSVEWSGPLASIALLADVWRPSTWPPPAHALPIGIACSVALLQAQRSRTYGLGLTLLILSTALLVLFRWLPRYSPPGLLGITRPTLIPAPLSWAGVGWLCWYLRRAERLLLPLVYMSVVMLLAHVSMLYSQAPHDSEAMVAHLGKLTAYLVLLLTVFQFASADMTERVRAENALAQLNDELERRIDERTAQLQAQLERMNLLDRITHAIGERQDLDSIFLAIVRNLEERLPVSLACVCLWEAEQACLIVARTGVSSRLLAEEAGLMEQARIAVDENGLSRCMQGQLVHEPDIGNSTFAFARRLARTGLRSLVCAPLQSENQVFGVLLAARSQANDFSSGDCEFLRQLSEHVALAANQARIHGDLQTAYDDLRQSQFTVMQQERLRALGQMASGIAHDINNALSPVGLYAESLLEHESGLSERGRNALTTIQHSIESVSETVARMREFYRARGPDRDLAPVQINALVTQVIDLTRARWQDQAQQHGLVIELRTDLCTAPTAVTGAQSEIRDALTNLIFNAVDAMPEGGTLTLRTHVQAGEGPGAAADRQVIVEVIDTGVGMDEHARQRCLEPFFTTKGERGTGLGLAMVYGMVQRHAAELEIESRSGHGTTVRLLFPAASATPGASRYESAPEPPMPLRILLVDDDPLVIRSLSDTLQSDGHWVTAADGGQAGIDTFVAAQERQERFDVVITDLGMPYVDGRKVAAKLRVVSPTTPIVLLTGWGQRLIAEQDVPPEVCAVLSKPPRLSQLRATLADVTAPREVS